MRRQGGFATLGQLNTSALKVPGVTWGTKTPFASIRRIVQKSPEFYRIRPGLWGLVSERKTLDIHLGLADGRREKDFTHSLYQGYLVEIGNLRGHKTYVPPQDKSKLFLGTRLETVSTLPTLPDFTYPAVIRRASTVDVIWMDDRDFSFPLSLFEVENSTDFQNSFAKFVDLRHFAARFVIVADASKRRLFEDKKQWGAFETIKNRLTFIDYDGVAALHDKEQLSASMGL